MTEERRLSNAQPAKIAAAINPAGQPGQKTATRQDVGIAAVAAALLFAGSRRG